MPQLVVPFSMFFASDLPILGGGVKANVPKVLLQQPQPVTGVIHFHGMNAERIPQTVWTDTPCPTGFGVNQRWQTRSPSTISDYLPCPMSVEVEKGRLIIGG